MSTNAHAHQEGTDVEHESEPETAYTRHYEPLEQGGAEYVRCTDCGRELLVELGGRQRLTHADGCRNANRGR